MNTLEKPNEESRQRSRRKEKLQWRLWHLQRDQVRDVRAKARLCSWTLKGDLERKITTLQTSAIHLLKQSQKDRACIFVSFLTQEVRR